MTKEIHFPHTLRLHQKPKGGQGLHLNGIVNELNRIDIAKPNSGT